jgi:hypothetical protein
MESAMQCKDKIKYLDPASAMSTVRRMKRKATRLRVRNQLVNPPKPDADEHENLGVYKCIHCSFYHVGHDNRRTAMERARIEQRDERILATV